VQGLSRFTLVAASAAQSAAGAVQAGTKDITAKVECLLGHTLKYFLPPSNISEVSTSLSFAVIGITFP
jgi:hypothetical protein